MQRNQPDQSLFGYVSHVPLAMRHARVNKLVIQASGFSYVTLLYLIRGLDKNAAPFVCLFALIGIVAGKRLKEEFSGNFGMNEFRGLEEVAAQPERRVRAAHQFYVFSSPEELRRSFGVSAISTAIFTLAVAALFDYYVTKRPTDTAFEIGVAITGLLSLLGMIKHAFSDFNARTIDVPNNMNIQRVF